MIRCCEHIPPPGAAGFCRECIKVWGGAADIPWWCKICGKVQIDQCPDDNGHDEIWAFPSELKPLVESIRLVTGERNRTGDHALGPLERKLWLQARRQAKRGT